jgi:group I intron endonuclease
MNRYENGKIYKLVNNVDEKIYVGSTCLPLAKRLYRHKNDAKREKRCNTPAYKHLNEIGWENVEIILVEEFPTLNKYNLEKRERYWIDTLHPELNKNIPTRTKAEMNAQRCKENYAQHWEERKQYREDHKEQIKARQSQKYECECGGKYTYSVAKRHKRSKRHLKWMSEQ